MMILLEFERSGFSDPSKCPIIILSMGPLRRALPLLILCGSALAAGPSWRELLDQADRLSAEDKNAESVGTAQRALADAEKSLGPEDPERSDVLARVSRIYERTGAAPQLADIEKRLSAVKSKDFNAWLALGRLYRGDGRFPEAEEALKKALAFTPDEPSAGYELALVYDDTGRFEKEIPLLKEVIEKRPDRLTFSMQLAKAYARLGRSGEAKETFAKARKIGGKAAAAYVNEGYFYLRAGEGVHSKESFESAIAVDTSSALGYHHMGTYLLLSRRYAEAEKYLRIALEKEKANPNEQTIDILPETMNRLGAVIEAQGRDHEAEAVYLEALDKEQVGRDRLASLRALANLYSVQGKSVQAEETFKRAVAESSVRFNGDHFYAGVALIDLGRFYLSQGRRAEAEAMAERAEKFSADIPIRRDFIDVLRVLAAFDANLGDVSKREALYARLMPMRRAMPSNPDLVWVETGLSGLEAARGRFPAAEEHDRQAIEILEHNSRWREEADVLDDLAAIDEKDGKAGAGEAREKAKSLRARP